MSSCVLTLKIHWDFFAFRSHAFPLTYTFLDDKYNQQDYTQGGLAINPSHPDVWLLFSPSHNNPPTLADSSSARFFVLNFKLDRSQMLLLLKTVAILRAVYSKFSPAPVEVGPVGQLTYRERWGKIHSGNLTDTDETII